MNHPALYFAKEEIFAQDSVAGTASPNKILLNIINHELIRQRRG